MLRNKKDGIKIENIKSIITTGVEYETGRIIDGKIEYAKRINLGTLPNAAEIRIQTNIGRKVQLIKLEAAARRSSDKVDFPIPYASIADPNTNMQIVTLNDCQYIQVKTSSDKSDCTAVATIYYVNN